MARAKNEGSIRKRPDGRFEVRVRDPLSGRRRSLFAKTEAEALAALKAAQRQIDDGVALGAGRLSVAQYLASWLDSVKPSIRATTHQRYDGLVRLQIVP